MDYIYKDEERPLAIRCTEIRENEEPLLILEDGEFDRLCQENIGKFAIINSNNELVWEDNYEVPQSVLDKVESDEARKFLEDTDNYAIRIASGEATLDDYSSTYDCTFREIMSRRAEARSKIK